MKLKQGFAVFALAALSNFSHASEENVRQPHIVGGNNANISALPWQVYIDIPSSGCGGVIISNDYVLTAAHCVEGLFASDISVLAGFTDLSSPRSPIPVANIQVHPDYNNANLTADIAILKLAGSLPSNAKSIPLLMAENQSEMDNEFQVPKLDNLVSSGWGATRTGGAGSQSLKMVALTGVPDSSCSWTTFSNGSVSQAFSDAYVCANNTTTEGICSGDSGGPLVWQNPSNASDADRGYRLAGLVSFSSRDDGCASPNAEDGFTQVSTYFSWIDANMDGGYSAPSVSFAEDIFALATAENNSGGGGGGVNPLLLCLVFLFRIFKKR
ncbi:S1 family peptidase [Grimontia marina]|uniref:Trypsin n=1 Tax=Grimontia marina TaxID=646534 RepID=A0A128EV11_9GAMM|nr:serine protease [Grimontia marina]CZF77831.1 Trypsin [Grimontia marina]